MGIQFYFSISLNPIFACGAEGGGEPMKYIVPAFNDILENLKKIKFVYTYKGGWTVVQEKKII